MNHFLTIGLLICSNIFMTFAWYGHLKLAENAWFSKLPLFGVIVFSWLIAFFEYCFQVPANRLGHEVYTLSQLKVIQEVITLLVFTVFTIIFFKTESLKWNHLAAFFCLILAVYFIFRK